MTCSKFEFHTTNCTNSTRIKKERSNLTQHDLENFLLILFWLEKQWVGWNKNNLGHNWLLTIMVLSEKFIKFAREKCSSYVNQREEIQT